MMITTIIRRRLMLNWEAFNFALRPELSIELNETTTSQRTSWTTHLPRAQSVVVAGAERAYSVHRPLDTMGRHSGWGSDTPQHRSWTKKNQVYMKTPQLKDNLSTPILTISHGISAGI